MDNQKFKRDETPYLVFPCMKCHQFSYVKTSQKTKKCLRCGRTHQVSKILSTGNIVRGMTNAFELVKIKQSEFKKNPRFEAENSFEILYSPARIEKVHETTEQPSMRESDEWESLFFRFKDLLLDLANQHESFPMYLIMIMAEKYSIPKQKIPALVQLTIKKDLLHYSKKMNHYFLS